VLGLCVVAIPVAVSTAQKPSATTDEAVALVLPTRRPPDAPPIGPPELPPAVERIPPLTLSAVTRRVPSRGRPQTLQQTITRTIDRVHVARGDKREWLFERNTIDPRRVSGLLVDHTTHTIVIYEESDLRLALGIRGWADVLCLGFDPGLLRDLTRSGKTRDIGGVQFAHYAGARDRDHDEVWWSDAHAFASRVINRDATAVTTFAVERVSQRVDLALLEPSPARFPSYRLVDLAEWLEHR
jgi:hypothetical protein